MSTTTPKQSASADRDNAIPEPKVLETMLIPDDKIDYPDSAAWQNLGPTIRREAAQRQRLRARRFRQMGWLAVAATVMLAAVIGVIAVQRHTATNSTPTSAFAAPAHPDRHSAAPRNLSVDLAVIAALTDQFKLDYVALELARQGITHGKGAAGDTGQLLANLQVDAVGIYQTAQQN